MRVAIFSDIHANKIGLEAVLNDLDTRGNIDQYWILGDYCLGGGDPIGVMELLSKLPNAQFIRGNTDRYIVNPDLPSPLDVEEHVLEWLVKTTQSQYWTQGSLSQTRWLHWLQNLPLEITIPLSDNLNVLLVHSSPGRDDGMGFHPDQDDHTVKQQVVNATEQLICVGHTHRQHDRKVDTTHIINPGSIGKPVTADKRATYTILDINSGEYMIQSHAVEFDIDKVVQQMLDIGYPGVYEMKRFYLA